MAFDVATTQFQPVAELRVTDPAVYAQIKADYGLDDFAPVPNGGGWAHLFGVSPVTLSAQYGVTIVNNAVGVQFAPPSILTFTSASQVLGVGISTSANGPQTLSGVTYTDPNGTAFTTVTWEWLISVELFTGGVGKFEEQVVTWTGDGTTNRLIPTTVDLSSGLVSVWGCGGAAGVGTTQINFFRHNQNMGGTMVMGITGLQTDGILSFEAGGFRVSPGVSSGLWGNTTGVPYTAVVLKDGTSDRRYMRVGTYRNMSGASFLATTTFGSTDIVYFSGTAWIPDMNGVTISDGTNNYTFTYVSATHATITPGYLTVGGGIKTFTVATDVTKVIPVTQNGGATPAVFPVTHAWVWGSTVAHKSSTFPGTDKAVTLISGGSGSAPVNTLITALGTDATGFTVAAGNAWTFNVPYAYMVLNANAEFLAYNLFQYNSGTAGAPPTVIAAMPFTPTLMFGRQGSAVFSQGGVFRDASHTGTQSSACSAIGGSNNLPANGIVAQGAGTYSLGSLVANNGDTYCSWAFPGTGTSGNIFPPPSWVLTTTIDLGDGTTTTIETIVASNTSPGTNWAFMGAGPTPGWWCQPAFGLSVYQINSPGTGWVACSGPATDNGWYLSTDTFASHSTIVSSGRPADPRSWEKIATWCTIGNMSVYGGSPAASCSINNHLVYPARIYTVGTDHPPIRIFNGKADSELCQVPSTALDVVPNAVMSMLAANGTVYFSTWDTGTTSADWRGRVFQLDPETGVQTVLGLRFAAGELPYALAWHMGRLWCGTNNGIGTVGKVYFFRPGIDTVWTLDHSTATETTGGVTAMQSYLGKLYVATDNAAAAFAKLLVRDSLGVYTTSDTGTGGTARVNNGYLALQVLGANLYASYWNNDTTPVSKIRKFDGTTWTTAYTGASTTLKPYIVLWLDNAEVYAIGGSKPYTATLLVTANGTLWTDLTAELPESTKTLLPMVGALVT